MSSETKLTDYLNVLWKWKNFIIFNLFIIGVLVTGLTFLIPETYKAKAVVMIPQNSQSFGLGAISGLLGGAGSLLGGKSLGGLGSGNVDKMMGILESRSVFENVINKYNLTEYYDIKDNNRDLLLKAFKSDVEFELNDNRMIEINVVNKNAAKSAVIANYFVSLLDSLNKYYGIIEATNNRGFIEKRYLQNLADLKSAEDSLNRFQKKYGVFSVPDQVKAAIQAAGNIESEMIKQEILSNSVKQQLGENSPAYKSALEQLNFIQEKVHELKRSDKLSYESNVLLPFKNTPDLGMRYIRLVREIEIQQEILKVVLPMYEQAKIEEQKNIATVIVLDSAVPPEYKYAPKKATIIIAVMFPLFFLLLIICFILENGISNNKTECNQIELKLNSLAQRLSRIYKVS